MKYQANFGGLTYYSLEDYILNKTDNSGWDEKLAVDIIKNNNNNDFQSDSAM